MRTGITLASAVIGVVASVSAIGAIIWLFMYVLGGTAGGSHGSGGGPVVEVFMGLVAAVAIAATSFVTTIYGFIAKRRDGQPSGPHQIAAVLTILMALVLTLRGGFMLFVFDHGINVAGGVLEFIRTADFENAAQLVWNAIAIVMMIAFGVAYFLGLSRLKPAAVALFALSIALGLSAFHFSNPLFAIFMLMPNIWGYLSICKSPSSKEADSAAEAVTQDH